MPVLPGGAEMTNHDDDRTTPQFIPQFKINEALDKIYPDRERRIETYWDVLGDMICGAIDEIMEFACDESRIKYEQPEIQEKQVREAVEALETKFREAVRSFREEVHPTLRAIFDQEEDIYF
jgi:hypothetical protein